LATTRQESKASGRWQLTITNYALIDRDLGKWLKMMLLVGYLQSKVVLVETGLIPGLLTVFLGHKLGWLYSAFNHSKGFLKPAALPTKSFSIYDNSESADVHVYTISIGRSWRRER
jgi:hypothetical protein